MGWAQGSGTSTVAGTVVDSSGAMVQSANVEVRDKNTNVARRTSTNGAGQFAFENVLPGDYAIAVNKEGFRPAELNVKVDVGRSYSFKVALVIGQASQVINVDATAQQLETTDATVGDVLRQESLMRLPNNVLVSPAHCKSRAQQCSQFDSDNCEFRSG